MQTAVRTFVVLVVTVTTFLFVYWVPFSLVPGDIDEWMALAGSLICALLAGRFVWRRTASVAEGVVGHVVIGAFVVGGFGFAAGFFGPMIVTPDANQGPLLGLFVTGPLGFVLGAIGGGVHWFARGRHAGRPR